MHQKYNKYFSEISDPNATPERKVKTISRGSFKSSESMIQGQGQHSSTSTPRQGPVQLDFKENYSQIYTNGLNGSSSSTLNMSESTEFFEKGSLITLENGDCKKIEDLNKDDFLKVSRIIFYLNFKI